MSDRLYLTLYPVNPERIFVTVLVVSFATEFSVMSMLPLIVPEGSSKTLEAAIDSCLLTAILAPIVWFRVIRPIQLLSQSRLSFLRLSMIAQETERTRIKQELHDGLGQTLTSMMLGLRAIEETTGESKVVEIVRQLRRTGAVLHDDLRRIVSGLHPTVLDQGGLQLAVTDMANEFGRVANAQIRVTATDLDNQRFGRNYETLVYRIIQESVNNAVKHSGASEIGISLVLKEQVLKVEVTDNGCGFSPRLTSEKSKTSYGLIGLRERALAVGGTIEIVSGKAGTRIRAELPVVKQEENAT